MKKNSGKPVNAEVIIKVKKISECVKNFFSWLWNHKKTVAARQEAQKAAEKAIDYLNKNEKTRKIVEKVSQIKVKKRRVGIFTVMVILLIVVANFIFPLHRKPAVPERIVRCDVFEVKKIDFSDELFVMGLVRGERSIDIGFQVAGIVKKIYAAEGSPIR